MNRALRPFALVLSISAMLLRAILPLGWMPSTDTRAPLVICPMMGGMMPAAPAHPGLPHHHESFCPFTASLAHLSAPALPPLIALAVEKSNARELSAIAFIVPARSYRPQSSRGPPLST